MPETTQAFYDAPAALSQQSKRGQQSAVPAFAALAGVSIGTAVVALGLFLAASENLRAAIVADYLSFDQPHMAGP